MTRSISKLYSLIWRPRGIVFPAFALLALALSLFTLSRPVQAAESDPMAGLVGLERLGAWFELHPDLKETRSSGWKPYNREAWLRSVRSGTEGADLSALRYEAFLEARAGEAESAGRGEPGWFSIGPVEYSGRCPTLDFDPTDPNTVYVGTAGGGLWKTTDGGDSWNASTDDLPTLAVGAVCVLASDPNVVLMGTGEGSGIGFLPSGKGIFGFGLLKSTDAGATWNPTSLSYDIPSLHGFSVIEDNPTTGTILAGANDGLWRSTDLGDTWTEVGGGGNFFDVKWKPGDPTTVYATRGRDPFIPSQSAPNGVLISTDDGLTFGLAGTGQPPSPGTIGKTKIAVTPANPDYIYAHIVSVSAWASFGIYRSTDGGQTWERRTSLDMSGNQGWYNNVIAVDPNDPERVVAGGNRLYRSTNGGSGFAPLNFNLPFGDDELHVPHWDNHALAYEPGSLSNLWVATDGGPWRSTDDGETWFRRTAGIISYQFYDIGVAQSDPFFLIGGTQDNGMPGRIDEDSWFQSTRTTDGMVCNIDPADANRVYSESQSGRHVRSLDGGQNWNTITNGFTGTKAWLTPVDMDPVNVSRLWTASSNGIFRTVSAGSQWTNVATHKADWIATNPLNPDVVWTVSNESGVYFSTDGGDSWTQSASFSGTGQAIKIAADPNDIDSAFVVFGGYDTGGPHIIRTTDFGTTWEDVTGDFPDQPATTFIADPSMPEHWYVGSDVGVWRSSDGGSTWMTYGSGLANALVTDLEIRLQSRKLVAGTFGRGAWEIDLPTSSSVGNGTDNDSEMSVASQRLMLDPPHPNPVSDDAILRFAARTGAQVQLEIYDVHGRKLETIVSNGSGDGVVQVVPWSARDLPVGMYLMRLTSGGERLTRKVLVSR